MHPHPGTSSVPKPAARRRRALLPLLVLGLAGGISTYSLIHYTGPRFSSTPSAGPAHDVRAHGIFPVDSAPHPDPAASRITPPVPMPADDTPDRYQTGARTRWLHDWASRDFESALAWARQQPSALRDWALGHLSLVLAQADPKAALDFCEDERLTERSVWTTASVLQMHAADSPAEAYTWVLALPEGPLRGQCAPRLFAELAVGAPDLAGNLVAHAGGSGTDSDGVQELVEHWTRLAPETAGNWLLRQTDAAWQPGAITTLVARWAKDDTTAAAAWIEQLPDDTTKARAREAFDLHRNRAPVPPS